MPSGSGGEIYVSLREYERRSKSGYAFPDDAGFIVKVNNRASFSPDAAFYKGELQGEKFPKSAPVFAVEVRSSGDYGPAAEREMAAKRQHYFAVGTLKWCGMWMCSGTRW